MLSLEKKYPPRLKEKTDARSPDLIVGGDEEFIAVDSVTKKFIAHYVPGFVKGGFGHYLRTLKYSESLRGSGLESKSQIFGYAPRDYLKNLPTRRCRFDEKNPKAAVILEMLAREISEVVKLTENELYQQQAAALQKIEPIWKFKDSLFTSGIINLDTKYMYHTDNGNLDGCWSGMLTFKEGVENGDLHLPEYNALIKNNNGSLLLFDGASVSHGVTEWQLTEKKGFRITIVFYALEALKLAAKTYKEELDFFNSKQLKKHEEGFYAKK
jgi:hypothetical protein